MAKYPEIDQRRQPKNQTHGKSANRVPMQGRSTMGINHNQAPHHPLAEGQEPVAPPANGRNGNPEKYQKNKWKPSQGRQSS